MRSHVVALLAVVALGATARPYSDALTPAVGKHAMVVTEQHLASQIGLEVLKHGGNAVDAAVAVAYALAVVDPCCGNLGGGGFMLVRMHDGRERFIDFREKAPLHATRDMYLDKNGNDVPERSRKGWLAIGVPGTVAGMERARTQFGTMSRAALLGQAERIARDGWRIVPGDLLPFGGAASAGYSGFPPNARAIFLPHGRLPQPGDVIVQRDLANTIEGIIKDGPAYFYRGPVAHDIVDASKAGGGVLTLHDFADYSVDESQPAHCSYHGYEIVSSPPPSSGGTTLCEILDILSPFPLGQWGWHSPKSAHYVAEAERRAYADRNTYLGDPRFVKDPVAQLLSPSYAAKLRAEILPDKATPSTEVKPGLGIAIHENDDTTHFSIVDAAGNAVAVTYTINDWFGSGVIAPGTGFFLNDEMDDFTSKPGVPNMFGLVQGERNDIQPGKRPLSSMTPTIVLHDGKVRMVTGSPGGARIITIALATILNVLDYGMNVQQAVDAPRMHMQWLPDRIDYEPGAFAPSAMTTLRAMGYTLHEIPAWGSAQAIVIDPATGIRYGGTDRRHPAGAAVGY